MGKATILSGGPNGNYQVRMDYGKKARDTNIVRIIARMGDVTTALANVQALVDQKQALEDAAKQDAQAAIDAYVAATQAVPVADQAVTNAKAALATLSASPSATPLQIADAQGAVTAARAAYTAAQAAIKATLDAYTKAATALVKAKRATAELTLTLEFVKAEQTQLEKDLTYWQNVPVEQTLQAWCADLTEDATGIVATLEIPGESKLIIIEPGAPVHVPTTHGDLTAREVQTPAQAFFNAAILPGWQKFRPTYRRGVITALNVEADKANVTLAADDTSSAQALGINQTAALVAVPVEYMACNASVFAVGDACIVKFKDHDWAQPRVVGFVNNPKPCALVLSGLVKVGVVVAVGGKNALRSYQPNPQAWQYPLASDPAKSPTTFNDELRLGNAGAQYAAIVPSAFSGRMAKAVQVIMGRGTVVPYDYHWANCHGITIGADGKAWLIEISITRGVLAMLLPVSKLGATSAQDVLRESYALFGGLPTGGTFPVGATLNAAITDGSILQLKTVADMAGYFANSAYHMGLGWSFNGAGTEAHNTCYSVNAAERWGHHYKLAISIGAVNATRQPGTPMAVATADVMLVESARLYRLLGSQTPFGFSGVAGIMQLPTEAVGSLPDDASAPVLVCHISGVLDVVRLHISTVKQFTTGGGSSCGGAAWGANSSAYSTSQPAGPFVASNSFPYGGFLSTTDLVRSYTHIGQSTHLNDYPSAVGRSVTRYRRMDAVDTYTSKGGSSAVWSDTARDCYAFYTEAESWSRQSGAYYDAYGFWTVPPSLRQITEHVAYNFAAIIGTNPQLYTLTQADEITAGAVPCAPLSLGGYMSPGTYTSEGLTAAIAAARAQDTTFTPPDNAPLPPTGGSIAAKVQIVIADGTVFTAPAYPAGTFGMYGWRDPPNAAQHPDISIPAPPFPMRHSAFGAVGHMTHPPELWGSKAVLQGPQFGSEPSPTIDEFNFVGYL